MVTFVSLLTSQLSKALSFNKFSLKNYFRRSLLKNKLLTKMLNYTFFSLKDFLAHPCKLLRKTFHLHYCYLFRFSLFMSKQKRNFTFENIVNFCFYSYKMLGISSRKKKNERKMLDVFVLCIKTHFAFI